jgi:hypothetical protein
VKLPEDLVVRLGAGHLHALHDKKSGTKALGVHKKQLLDQKKNGVSRVVSPPCGRGVGGGGFIRIQ